jgi:hypothetical protein
MAVAGHLTDVGGCAVLACVAWSNASGWSQSDDQSDVSWNVASSPQLSAWEKRAWSSAATVAAISVHVLPRPARSWRRLGSTSSTVTLCRSGQVVYSRLANSATPRRVAGSPVESASSFPTSPLECSASATLLTRCTDRVGAARRPADKQTAPDHDPALGSVAFPPRGGNRDTERGGVARRPSARSRMPRSIFWVITKLITWTGSTISAAHRRVYR